MYYLLELLNDGPIKAVGFLVASVLYLIYLFRSARVKNTYFGEVPNGTTGGLGNIGQSQDTAGGKNKARAIVAIAVLGILGASCAVYAYQNRKSRDEALQWMQDFVPEHAGFDASSPGDIWRTSYTLKNEGCLITLIDLNERSAPLHDYVHIYKLSLADLDPTSVP